VIRVLGYRSATRRGAQCLSVKAQIVAAASIPRAGQHSTSRGHSPLFRVLVIGSNRFHREELSRLLSASPHMERVDALKATADVADSVNDLSPDVIAVDAGPLAEVVVREIRRVRPATPIVALGVTDSEEEIVALAEAGTATLVMAEEPPQAILAAVESAVSGQVLGASRIATILQRRLAELTHFSRQTDEAVLTRRQIEILNLLGEGLTAKEIALRLVIAPRTVRNHIQRIYIALGVHRRSEAVAWLRERTATVP
jgi:two-component system, NarL family, response regulator DevR